MRRILLRMAVLALVLAGWGSALAALLVPGEAGSFVFRDPGYFASRPVTVHYFRPEDADADAPLLIALHGTERAGAAMRDHWMHAAVVHRLIVIAPEFTARDFGAQDYQHGGMHRRDRSGWTFGVIERLFDHVRREAGLAADSYILFGHSGGGQFVQRMVLLMPEARYSVAVAANPGSYTAPAYGVAGGLQYPATLDPAVVPPAQLQAAFARRLVLLLGEEDTRQDTFGYPADAEARQFGGGRLERGRNFYARARVEARAMRAPFAWELHTIFGVGHDARLMAAAAARLLFTTPHASGTR